MCFKALFWMYFIEVNTNINNLSLLSAYGGEVFGIQYSFFSNAANARRIYALISSFYLTTWIILIMSSHVVALLLLTSQVNFNPFFCLFTIMLEQNCTTSSKITNSDVFLVFVWLFGAYLLRNAYKSNLYT